MASATPHHYHITCTLLPLALIHAFLILIPRLFYRYCLVGIAIMFAGVLYWAAWRILLPKVFGSELLPRKETLDDGTVVTVVSVCVFQFRVLLVFDVCLFAHPSYFQVFE